VSDSNCFNGHVLSSLYTITGVQEVQDTGCTGRYVVAGVIQNVVYAETTLLVAHQLVGEQKSNIFTLYL